MRRSIAFLSLPLGALLAACSSPPMAPPTGPMGFFVTSVGVGDGGNLGGLVGADAHCQKLAAAAGAGQRSWRAYLSTSFIPPNTAAIHARDRIGKGPWFNAKGVLVARDVEHLHGQNNLTKATALTEKRTMPNGRTETPNQHDALTGSRPDGTAWPSFPGQPNMTCGEWTKNSSVGAGLFAMVGHFDRASSVMDPWGTSWNASHLTVSCSKDDLPKSGGAGLFYCFAAD